MAPSLTELAKLNNRTVTEMKFSSVFFNGTNNLPIGEKVTIVSVTEDTHMVMSSDGTGERHVLQNTLNVYQERVFMPTE